MAPLSTRYGGKLPKYHLYAACNHHGTMHSGHYTATARHHEDGLWYNYNDKRCSPTEPQHVVNADNYILFFEQRKGIGPRRQTLSAPEDWPFALSAIPSCFQRKLSMGNKSMGHSLASSAAGSAAANTSGKSFGLGIFKAASRSGFEPKKGSPRSGGLGASAEIVVEMGASLTNSPSCHASRF